MAEDWDLAWAGRLRDGWQRVPAAFEAGEKIATRVGRAEDDGGLRRVRARR